MASIRRWRRLIPREFFVTSGRGVSKVSKLNAYDAALISAGIAQCNLFFVSSVIPPKCKERRWKKLQAGTIAPTIMAKACGDSGETIGAGLIWAWEKNHLYGIVAEVAGHMDRKALREALNRRIEEMADARKIELGEIDHRIEVLKVPAGSYGCVLVALVFML